MIQVNNIKKNFGEKQVIKGVSVNMEPGKCNLIIGSSGSGKTVFTKCMVGLFTPEEGEVLYDGQNFTTMDFKEKKDIRSRTSVGTMP